MAAPVIATKGPEVIGGGAAVGGAGHIERED